METKQHLFSMYNINSYIHKEILDYSWKGSKRLEIKHCMLNCKMIQMRNVVKSAENKTFNKLKKLRVVYALIFNKE